MTKIKLLTDSACDLTPQQEAECNIEIMPFPITVGEQSYMERVDFTPVEFYDILKTAPEIPVTSHISAIRFGEKFAEVARAGYTDAIFVTISSTGSSTYDAAHMGLSLFREEQPQLAEQLNVHIVDSKTYSFGYGYPLMQAAKMIAAGSSAEQVVDYLEDAFARVEVYLSMFTLEYARKSGRIGAAAAFVGEKLGLKPIVAMIDGSTKTAAKVRGEKNLVPALAKLFAERRTDPDSPYIIVQGCDTPLAQQLAVTLTEQCGQPPLGIYRCGAAVAINSGPEILAFVILGEKRR